MQRDRGRSVCEHRRVNRPQPETRGLEPEALVAVWLGGTVGVGARHLLDAPGAGLLGPWLTFLINCLGALLLGVAGGLLPPGRSRAWTCLRLGVLTGVLGGFTTYSALAVDTLTFWQAGRPLTAVTYAGLTVVTGCLAAWTGIAAAGSLRGGRR